MSKKYELLEVEGSELYQVRALRDFGFVKEGQLGGFIEKEANLSHQGNAWVSENARVFDDAKVSGNAWVCGNASVFGNATVTDNAQVWGNATVLDDACVSGRASVFNYARVCDNALISENAWVFGMSWVWGNAQVLGSARVSGEASVSGDAKVSGWLRVRGGACVTYSARICKESDLFTASYVGTENGTLTVCNGKDGLIVTCGCFTGTVEEFLAKSAEAHDEKTQREYQLLIEVAKSRILESSKE